MDCNQFYLTMHSIVLSVCIGTTLMEYRKGDSSLAAEGEGEGGLCYKIFMG